MFSVKQKREIANKIQEILRATDHPELSKGEINFSLHVNGAEDWSWADIKNNNSLTIPKLNPWTDISNLLILQKKKH